MKTLVFLLAGCLVACSALAKDDIDERDVKVAEKRNGKLPKGAPSLADSVAARHCKPMFQRCREEAREDARGSKSTGSFKQKLRKCFMEFLRTCFSKVKLSLKKVEQAVHDVGLDLVVEYLDERAVLMTRDKP